MTAVLSPESLDPTVALKARRLNPAVVWVVAAAALVASFVLFDLLKALGGGTVLVIVGFWLLFLLFLGITATVVEGGRAARNRVASSAIYSALVLALLPLVSIVALLISRGVERLDADFFTHSMARITAFDAGGGIYHAIIGTLEQVGIATLITVPLGILGAIYIVEYGRGKLAAAIRFFVDVMTGIPSIVAGLFILAFWVLLVARLWNKTGVTYSGFAASLALSVLMLPTVTRSTEEMLRLVPAALREGSYALGVPKWKTILRIVIPTALPGIVTGVMLAVARATGETAPVLLVAGGFNSINTNPFSGPQESLALYIYQQAKDSSPYAPARTWAAALTLVAFVLLLTVAAKLLARRNKLAR
jgi:phosphate transport system permease protein